MNPLISIIVPVYNVEDYLKACLDSIINQTYKNLEIILIDDGSTDNSGKICDEYAGKDNRIKLIHKPNVGLSDARNAGLEIAKGEYIGFVDSDDYIAEDMYEFLYNLVVDNDLDVAMCASCDVHEDGTVKTPKIFKTIFINEKEKIIENLFVNQAGGLAISVCNKLFKKKVIKNCKFTVGKTSEDVFFVLKWIENTDKFCRISDVKYYYVQHMHSITHQQLYTPKILDVIEAYLLNLDIISKKYLRCVAVAKARLYWAYRITIERIYDCKDYKENTLVAQKIQNELRKNLIDILKNKYISFKGKVGYVLIVLNIELYMLIKKLKF